MYDLLRAIEIYERNKPRQFERGQIRSIKGGTGRVSVNNSDSTVDAYLSLGMPWSVGDHCVLFRLNTNKWVALAPHTDKAVKLDLGEIHGRSIEDGTTVILQWKYTTENEQLWRDLVEFEAPDASIAAVEHADFWAECVPNLSTPAGDVLRENIASYMADALLDKWFKPIITDYQNYLADPDATNVGDYIRCIEGVGKYPFTTIYSPSTPAVHTVRFTWFWNEAMTFFSALSSGDITTMLTDADNTTYRGYIACDIYGGITSAANFTASNVPSIKAAIAADSGLPVLLRSRLAEAIDFIPLRYWRQTAYINQTKVDRSLSC